MEIRVLRPEEFDQLRDLLDGVFSRSNGRVTDFSRLFPRLFAAPNPYTTASHIGAFIDGKLVGTAAMYPLDYVIGTQHIRLIGNGNVAVHEDYRNRGVMTQILHKINEACDKIGDLGYLHGDPVRYGRVGYVGCGVEYLLTFLPTGHAEYRFCPMTPAEVPMQQARSEQRCDFIRRAPEDFILSLRSGSRAMRPCISEMIDSSISRFRLTSTTYAVMGVCINRSIWHPLLLPSASRRALR